MTLDDAYHVLCADLTWTDEQIKRAWRFAVQKFHPDRQPGYEAQFQEVHEAYRLIVAHRQTLPGCVQCGDSGRIDRHVGFMTITTICPCQIQK